MNFITWLALFALTSWIGYRVLRAVPPLLHTPLMSGMNALSGITVLAAMVALGIAARLDRPWVQIMAGLALALAMANVVGGFLVTHRMLRMFERKDKGKQP